MRIVTPEEAKALREILLIHEARTLSPDCTDPDKLNLKLDHLRGMLMDIGTMVSRPGIMQSKPF